MSAYYRHHIHSNSGQDSGLPKTFWSIIRLVFLALGLLCVAIAVVCFAAGGINFAQQEAFFARAEPATGTISSYQLHVRNSGLSEYCPLIEFTTKAGESFSYLGADCLSAPNASQVGQHVQLYYDPKNPNDNRTRGFGDEYTGLTLGVVGGVFFGALGVGVIVLGWGIAFLPGRLTAKSAADPAAQDEQHAARSAAAEAASFVKLKESLLAGGASEAEAEAQVEEKRRAVQEWKAKREGNNPDA
jgi:hypothetical protein